MTTSIPEAPGSGRTWDYRYCWLRDAYYALGAFRLLGHFEEREHFVQYLLNIAAWSAGPEARRRSTGSTARSDLDERVLDDWPGFGGDGPVRVGNGAARHAQNDIFGEMVLALTPIFLDERFSAERSAAALELLERLARKAISVVGTPDAGIWEYRTEWKPQTFSSLMCWAAADRMARVAARQPRRPGAGVSERRGAHPRGDRSARHGTRSSALRRRLTADATSTPPCSRWRPCACCRPTIRGCATRSTRSGTGSRRTAGSSATGSTTASVSPRSPSSSARSGSSRRSPRPGARDEAKSVMEHVHAALSPLGLLSEDYETSSLRMWGNFPQAYSHVGLIHAAFAASPRWAEVL